MNNDEHGSKPQKEEQLAVGVSISIGGSADRSAVIGAGGDVNFQQTISQDLSGDDLAKLFAAIYRQINVRPVDPDVDKEELIETIEKIESEAKKGEQANPNKLERWLGTLSQMAPDIFEVAVTTLTNPAAGIATVVRKVGERAKQNAGSKG